MPVSQTENQHEKRSIPLTVSCLPRVSSLSRWCCAAPIAAWLPKSCSTRALANFSSSATRATWSMRMSSDRLSMLSNTFIANWLLYSAIRVAVRSRQPAMVATCRAISRPLPSASDLRWLLRAKLTTMRVAMPRGWRKLLPETRLSGTKRRKSWQHFTTYGAGEWSGCELLTSGKIIVLHRKKSQIIALHRKKNLKFLLAFPKKPYFCSANIH